MCTISEFIAAQGVSGNTGNPFEVLSLPPDRIGMLVGGVASVALIDSAGNRVVYRFCGAGALLGLLPMQIHYEAITRCTLLTVAKSELRRRPEFEGVIMRESLAENRAMAEYLQAIAAGGGEDRLNFVLNALGDAFEVSCLNREALHRAVFGKTRQGLGGVLSDACQLRLETYCRIKGRLAHRFTGSIA